MMSEIAAEERSRRHRGPAGGVDAGRPGVCALAFTWPEPVDTLTMTANRQRLNGSNQYGVPVVATRVSGGPDLPASGSGATSPPSSSMARVAFQWVGYQGRGP